MDNDYESSVTTYGVEWKIVLQIEADLIDGLFN